jgi:hypothetical protein
MVSYAQRPDGMLDVQLDDGRVLPMALDPGQLASMSGTPAEARAGLYSGMAGTAPETRTGTEGLASNSPMIYANPAAPGALPTTTSIVNPAAAAAGPPEPSTDPADVMKRAEAERVKAQQARVQELNNIASGAVTQAKDIEKKTAGPASLVSATAQPGAAAPTGTAPESEVDRLTKAYLQSQLQPRGGGGGTKVPAHDQRVGFTIKKQLDVANPETEEALSEARIDEQLSKQDQLDQKQLETAGSARIAAEEARQAQHAIEETTTRRANIERDVGARMKRIDDDLAKARHLAERGTARERVFEDKGWFGRILAGLGTMLGDFATGGTGGAVPNYARQNIQDEVDNETQRQKDMIAAGEGERTALADALKVYGTPEAAEESLRLRLKEHALAKSKAWAAKSGNDQLQQNFDVWLAEENRKALEERRAFEQKQAGEVVEQYQYQPTKVVGSGSAPPDQLKALKKAGEFRKAYGEATGTAPDKDAAKKEEDLRERFVPQGGGYARSSAEAAKARDGLTAMAELDTLTNDAKNIRRDLREGRINPVTAQARLSTIKNNAMNAHRVATASGTLDIQSQEVFNNSIGKIDSWASIGAARAGFETPADTKLDEFQGNMRTKAERFRQNLSKDPGGKEPAHQQTPGSFKPK